VNDCEKLKRLTNEEQNRFIFLLKQLNKFFRLNVNLFINDVEIIAWKLKLFKNPVIDFINQEISAERER
jgi:hypothetical protein